MSNFYDETAVGILDIYSNESLLKCVQSLEKTKNSSQLCNFIVSNKKDNSKKFINVDVDITNQVGMAHLRNQCFSKFRCYGKKYLFLLTSNVFDIDFNFVEKTIKTAEAFGSWFLVGTSENPTVLDDTEKNQSLYVNKRLNVDFIFLRSGILGSLGYFDEKYINTTTLDVLDYIEKCRKEGLYPKHPYHLTVGPIYKSNKDQNILKIGHSDLLGESTPTVGFSYGYFQYKHKYIPDMDDVKEISKDELMIFMGDLQKNYGN